MVKRKQVKKTSHTIVERKRQDAFDSEDNTETEVLSSTSDDDEQESRNPMFPSI